MAMSAAQRMAKMRAKRAAGLEVAEPGLRDAKVLLGPAVEAAIGALKLGEKDAAVAQLARRYAAAADGAKDPVQALRVLGPLLLKSLTALCATPASRPAVRPGARAAGELNPVQQLRLAHQRTARGRGMMT